MHTLYNVVNYLNNNKDLELFMISSSYKKKQSK